MDTNWKPKAWVAVLLGIITQSFAFLYLNRPKIFWLYTALMCLLGIVGWYYGVMVGALLSIVCPIHAYFSAKHYDSSQQRRWFSLWWAIPSIYALLLLPILIVRIFFYEPYSIPASSMSPTINTGDIIIVKKYGYGNYSVYGNRILESTTSKDLHLTRGKIYAFYPPHLDTPYVKRLIGKPGDEIEILGDKISVNGVLLESKQVSRDDKVSINREAIGNISYNIQRYLSNQFMANVKVVVPQDSYFFLGDNRDNSADSRIWGVVPGNRIIGEVVYVMDISKYTTE